MIMHDSQPSQIDKTKYVTETNPLISLVRKQGTEHAFLVIEMLKNRERQIIQVDLFVDGDKPIFTASGYYLNGTSKIVPKLIDLEKLEKYNERGFYFQSFSCEKSECDALIDDVAKDSQREDIRYSSSGDGVIYKLSSSTSKEQHNCMTYIAGLLKKHLDIEMSNNSWLQFIIVRPSDVVPGDNKKGACLMM